MSQTNRYAPKPRKKDFKSQLERLEKIYDQSEEKYRLIKEIDQAILKVTDSKSLDEVFELIWSRAINKTGSKNGEIILVKHESKDVIKVYPPNRYDKSQLVEMSLCNKALLDKADKNIGDVHDKKYPEIRDGYYSPNPPNTKIKSELVVLIKPEGEDDKVLGLINFERNKLGEFSEDEIEWAKLLAGQAAIAVRHQQLWEGIQTLNQITVSLATGGGSPETVFQDIIDKIVEWTDSEQCYILQKGGNEFLILGSKDENDFGLRATENSFIGRTLRRISGKEKTVIYHSELQKKKDRTYLVHTKGRKVQSVLIIPLIENEQVIGALYLDDSRPRHYSEYVIELLKVLGGVLSKTLAATSWIARESQKELIGKAKYILSQLESVKDNFTHRYGSNIGDSRGKLLELKSFLNEYELPDIPERNMSVSGFIDWIVSNLEDEKEELLKFSKEYGTKHIIDNTRSLDLLELTKRYIEKYKKNCPQIDFYLEDAIPNGFKKGIYISTFCRLNNLIEDVFDNLVENAIQSIEKSKNAQNGQIKFTVKVENSQNITLEIKDNGTGISEDIRPKIFQGYSSKNDPDLHGKGLSFCNLYVWAHGGDIDVDSTEGDGATFILTFPTVQDPNK